MTTIQYHEQRGARLWKALRKVGDHPSIKADLPKGISPEEAADRILDALNIAVDERVKAAEYLVGQRYVEGEVHARVARQARDELGVIAVNRRDRIINLEAALRTAIKALELRDDGEESTNKILEVMKGYLDGTKGLSQ